MQNSKTFRFFISSTFSDFKRERQALQEKVFPTINKYLQVNHPDYTFQPIDFRWGVSEEAQYDQKTLELCLDEVRSCKHYLHPNFLIMTGHRYGWVPLPYAIEKNEYYHLYNYLLESKEEELGKIIEYLDYWYKEDKNHLNKLGDTHFILQVRKNENENTKIDKLFRQDFKALNSDEKDYNIYWAEHEGIMLNGFQKAVKALIQTKELSKDKERKYIISATESEVEEGIFQYLLPTKSQKEMKKEQANLAELDKEHIFGFFRNIDKIDYEVKENQKLKNFHESLTNTLLDTNSIHSNEKENYLDDFSNKITEKLIKSIEKQIEEQKNTIPNIQKLDYLEQEEFKNKRTKIFEGRKDEIKKIKDYIDRETFQPFVVHGVSGIGKSAFIANLTDVVLDKIDKTKRDYPVYYRFVGATSVSSNLRTLLESLIEQLSNENVFEKPKKYELEINKFYEQVKELLGHVKKPVIIILDALDQLQVKDYLQWLPESLDANVKIILSVLDEGETHYWDILKEKIDEINILELKKISDKNVETILCKLLENVQRKLTSPQTKYVFQQVADSGNSPLYLKIAFEEVKTWKSFDNETLSIGIKSIIEEYIDNLTDKFHHNKEVVHKVLGLIKASKDGLSEKEILDLLSRDDDILNLMEKYDNKLTLCINGENVRRFPISIWVRLYDQLKPFLMIRLIDGQNLIKFFHRQVDEVVGNYIYEPQKIELHSELADYFLILQDKEKLWNKRYYDLHMLDEVPYQLFYAEDSRRLQGILFDIEFSSSVYDNHKQDSFRGILEIASQLNGILHDEIYPWESFYREKEHLILNVDEEQWRPHQSLFQLAYEDGSDSPLSHQADYLLKDGRVDFFWLRKRKRAKNFFRSGLQKVFKGHTNPIVNVKILDNNKILSYSSDKTLRLWTLDGQERAVFKGHKKAINGVVILDKNRFLSYEDEGFLLLWNMNDATYTILEEKFHSVTYSKLLNDGRFVSYSDYTKSLCFCDTTTKKLSYFKVERFLEILNDVRLLTYFDESRDSLLLWDPKNNQEIIFKGHAEKILGAKILGNKILSYSQDNTLKLWSFTGHIITVFTGHTGAIFNVKIFNDDRIFSYSRDGTVRLWNHDGRCEGIFRIDEKYINIANITDCILLDKNSILVSCLHQDKMAIIRSDGKVLAMFEDKRDLRNNVKPKRNSIKIYNENIIIFFGNDGYIELWNTNGEMIYEFNIDSKGISGIEILEDERLLVYTHYARIYLVDLHLQTSLMSTVSHKILVTKKMEDEKLLVYFDNKTLKLYDLNGNELTVINNIELADKIKDIDKIKLLNNGKILTYVNNGCLKLWNKDGEEELVFNKDMHIDNVEVLDESRILTCSNGGILLLWNLNGTAEKRFKGDEYRVKGVKILNKNTIISYSNYSFQLWNINGTALMSPYNVYNPETDNNMIYNIKILSDSLMAIISFGNDIMLFNPKDKKLLTYLPCASNLIANSGCDKLLTYSKDNTLTVWNKNLEEEIILIGHKDSIKGVKFLYDNRILSYSKDNTIRIWNNKGKEESILNGHKSNIWGVESINNENIISYSHDKTLRIWNRSGIQLGIFCFALEDYKILKIEQNHLYILNGIELSFYDFYKGNKSVTLNNTIEIGEMKKGSR